MERLQVRTAKDARTKMDPYPGKYGPQDVYNNFARNMDRRCRGNRRRPRRRSRRRRKR